MSLLSARASTGSVARLRENAGSRTERGDTAARRKAFRVRDDDIRGAEFSLRRDQEINLTRRDKEDLGQPAIHRYGCAADVGGKRAVRQTLRL